MIAAYLQQEFETEFAGLLLKKISYRIMTVPENGRTGIIRPVEAAEPVSPDAHHIYVYVPFIFDFRKVPKTFRGFKVSALISSDSYPAEFRLDEEGVMSHAECWSEKRILAYAEEHALEICEEVNDYSLTFEEICDIVAGGSFEKHKKNFAEEDELEWENDEFDDEEE